LKKGESWYLIDVRWFKQWKKYVGYDQWDSYNIGEQAAHPGTIDNSSLLKADTKALKEHLVDDLDYVLVPEEAYKKLSAWYGVGEGQEAIVRRVIEQGMYVKHCKVEVYLMELKLCQNSDINTVATHAFSRADTIGTIEKEMRRMFNIDDAKEVRLWNRYMSNTYEHLSKKEITLQDAGLYQGQVIVIEVKNDDNTWPRQAKSVNSYSNTSYPSTRSGGQNGNDSSSSLEAQQGGRSPRCSTQSFDIGGYYGGGSSSSNGYDRGGNNKPGLCGLANLGNTCFMNSALQCMSNVPPLTDYMLSSRWEKELNRDNPLGMRGEIADSYNELVRDMWSGQRGYTVPRNFKVAVGRFAPQFSGYQQQDSQELLAFLLDGLHEDLNRIRRKPYIELKDSGGRSDQVVAKEAWDNYKKRNDSIIVDTFHGLLKSTVRCPECEKISVTFDPFCYLSLPLPVKKERLMEVIWVPLPTDLKPLQLKVTVPNVGTIKDLCKALSAHVGVSHDRMVVTDVYNRRFHKIFNSDEGVNHILDRDDIFIFEMPKSCIEDPSNVITLYIYLREKKYNASSHNSVSSQPLFGFPFILAVPRHDLTYQALYDLLAQRMGRYVRVPGEGEDWEDEEEEEDESGSADTQMDTAVDNPADDSLNNNTSPPAEPPSPSSPSRPKKRRVFSLRVANSFGRDEVGPRLTDDSSILRLRERSYLAVDWSPKAKDKFFDSKAAEDFEEHESMRSRGAQKKTVIQLDDCLKLFMKEEQLSKHDPWYCPDCKEHKCASKKFDLWSLPDILIIHLKRFSYNKYWRDKLDTLMEFPVKNLDLRPFLIDGASENRDVYNLIAVTNHYGGLGGGHYTAFGLNKDDGEWYYFDDSSVSGSSEDNVVTKAAYVLVYQRQHSSSKSKRGNSATSTPLTLHSHTNGRGSSADEDMETN